MQQTQDPSAPAEGERPDGHDCPEEEGSGSGSGSGSGESAAPSAGSGAEQTAL